MNQAPTHHSVSKNTRGYRWSISARLVFFVLILLLLSLLLHIGFSYLFPQATIFVIALVIFVMLPVTMFVINKQIQPMLALFRAMSGTVLSYQDRDFSFGLHWQRNDELADLVDAHNELGQVLREQRLDLVQRELLLDSMLQNTPVAMCLVSGMADRGHVVFANITARQLLHHGRKLEGHTFLSILAQVSPALQEAVAQGGDGLFTVTNRRYGNTENIDESVDNAKNSNNFKSSKNVKSSENTIHEDGDEGDREDRGDEGDDGDEIYHLSRRTFILNGVNHELFLIRHLTVELRRQEVQTWKKVIRVISHELNNSLAPVASLARSAHALLERKQLERLPEILHTIEERAEHLESFIHGYARFAKLPKPRLEKIEWPSFIQQLQSQMPFQLSGNLPQESMSFDIAQMEHALLNLLKNAHESGSSPEGVCVEVKRMFQSVRIEVQDQGSGMSDDVMSNALVPFYSTKRHGTGLGLALAREIAEAHGGRIMLNNREGGGLSVSLILPI